MAPYARLEYFSLNFKKLFMRSVVETETGIKPLKSVMGISVSEKMSPESQHRYAQGSAGRALELCLDKVDAMKLLEIGVRRQIEACWVGSLASKMRAEPRRSVQRIRESLDAARRSTRI